MNARFETIVTHEKPHLDEIAAIWFLRKFGGAKFPGIREAKIVFWTNGGPAPDGCSAEEYEEEDVLLVGVGRGRFDEHPINGERKERECATTLVAKALEINEEPALQKILRAVLEADTSGKSHILNLSSVVKVLHQQYPENPEEIMEWAMMALEALYQEQVQFFTATKAEFEKKAEIEEVRGPKGQTLRMVTIISDNHQMQRFARSPHGGEAAVIIQQRSSGNVQIFTNRIYGLTLADVAGIIRYTEQEAKGEMITTDWKTLRTEGKVPGAEEWYYHRSGEMLLNGSLTATDVPPTKVDLRLIQEAVRIGINPAAFEPSRAPSCEAGLCTSTRDNPCIWYPWGLQRCRRIRYQAAKARR